jgi:hypothetical protein
VNKPLLGGGGWGVGGGGICRWLLFFKKYEFEVIVEPRKLNVGPDHLSRIISGEYARNIDYSLLYAHLFVVQMVEDYFTNIVQLLSMGMAPSDMEVSQKKQLVVKEADYHLITTKLYKLGAYGILRRCVLDHEMTMTLSKAHKGIARGHYTGKATTQNILCAGL